MKSSKQDQNKNPLRYVQSPKVVITHVNIVGKNNAMDVSSDSLTKSFFRI